MTVTVTARRPAGTAHAVGFPSAREIPPVARPVRFDSIW